MLDLGGAGLHVKLLLEGIDVDVLQDVGLGRVFARHGIIRCREMEALEGRVLAEIEGVHDRDEGEGGAARGQAELCVADGADGEPVGTVAGQAVRAGHFDIVEVEFGGVEIVFLVGGDVVFAKLVVDAEARGQASRRQKGGQPVESEFHALQLVIKTVIRVDVGAVFEGCRIKGQQRKAEALAVIRNLGGDIRCAQDDAV